MDEQQSIYTVSTEIYLVSALFVANLDDEGLDGMDTTATTTHSAYSAAHCIIVLYKALLITYYLCNIMQTE